MKIPRLEVVRDTVVRRGLKSSRWRLFRAPDAPDVLKSQLREFGRGSRVGNSGRRARAATGFRRKSVKQGAPSFPRNSCILLLP